VKHCTGCCQLLSESEFYRSESRCKACKARYHKEWRDKNREHVRQKHGEYRSRNREKLRIKNREHKRRNKQVMQDRNRYWKYGITRQEFDALVAAAGYRCESCGGQPRPPHGWCIDHCHDTGEVRGVLCNRCNTGIGMLGDCADGVARALAYLTRVERKRRSA
jgi:hypothetical protein